MDVDLRRIYRLPFIGPAERSTPTYHGEGVDFLGVEYVRVRTEMEEYFEIRHHPLAEAKTVAQIDSYDWPHLDWWDYAAMPEIIERVSSGGRCAIMVFVDGIFETSWYLRGFEQFFMDLCTQPEIADAICRNVEKFVRERALRILDGCQGKIDIVGTGGDIGEQRQMLISPRLWRERIKPYTGKLISTFKGMGVRTFYHSCGSIVPVIDDLIEVGLDILEPIQVTATGMQPETLFPRFGDRLSFHGAIDEQHLLPYATAGEVCQQTKQTIDVLGSNGGYIVSSAHDVQADTPPENVVAMIRAAQDYRW